MGSIKTILFLCFLGYTLVSAGADWFKRKTTMSTISALNAADIRGCQEAGELMSKHRPVRGALSHLYTPTLDISIFREDDGRFDRGDLLYFCAVKNSSLWLVCEEKEIKRNVVNRCAQLRRYTDK